MQISFDTFISDTLSLVDNTIASFVKTGFDNMQGYLQPTLMIMATLYVMWMGYQALVEKAPLTPMSIIRHFTTLIIIMTLSTNWNYYHQFVYDIFTREPMEISRILAGSGQSAVMGLNHIWQNGCNLAGELFSAGSWKNPEYLIYGLLAYIATFANCLYALGLFVVAKMAIAILLAIGPLFIILMLWGSTRELTSGWIRGLVNYSLIPIITTILLLLTNTIAQTTLPNMQSTVDNPNSHVILSLIHI